MTMHTTIPKPCVRLLEQMEATYGYGNIEDLYSDPDAFVYSRRHGYIKRVMAGTYVLTEQAESLLVQQRLRRREKIDQLLKQLAEQRKHPKPKRTRAPAPSGVVESEHDDYRPADWYTQNTDIPPARLRKAGRAERKHKQVRVRQIDGRPHYHAGDAERWWESEFQKVRRS